MGGRDEVTQSRPLGISTPLCGQNCDVLFELPPAGALYSLLFTSPMITL